MPGNFSDNRGQLDTLSWQATQIEDRGYNANGLLTSIDRAFEGEGRVYDDASRLVEMSSSSVGTLTYSYDNNGNVLGEAQSGVMAQYSFTTQKPGAGTYAAPNTTSPSNQRQTGWDHLRGPEFILGVPNRR